MNSFRDKVAIVTGGASGIGRALCEELAQRGAVVFVADINSNGAQHVAAGITMAGYRAHPVEVDITQALSVDKLIAQAVDEYDRLDYMFNNAGIGIVAEVRDMELSHWQHILDINLWGVIHGTSAAYKVMVKQGTGHIVNTASGAGLFPLPMSVAYTTTKYGVVGLSTALRPEAAGLGIKVSVVCPGAVRTNILDATVYLKINPEAARAQSESFKMLEPARCAQIILRGVTRNKAIIPVTTEAQIGWWLYRLSPTLYGLFGRKIADELRKSFRQD